MNGFNKLCLTGMAGLFAVAAQTADAATLNSDSVTIWNAVTTGATINSASQQALPTNPINAPADLVAASTAFTSPMNYNFTSGTATIGQFFAHDSPTSLPPGSCGATCQGTTLSSAGFNQVSLFRFSFTDTALETFSVTHDDGVSLFAAGTTTTNLLPGASGPTNSTLSTITLAPGSYDLWYIEANGLPAVLQVTSSPVPLPAALPLFASGLVGLGLLGFRRKKKAIAA